MKIYILLAIFLQAIFFCRPYTNTINISKNNLNEVSRAMHNIQSTLEKSSYDSLLVFSRIVDDKMNVDLLYHPELNRDSLRLSVESDTSLSDMSMPVKQLSIVRDKTYILNGRYIGKSFTEFKAMIMTSSELSFLNKMDRSHVADFFNLLNKNNIWNCMEYEFQNRSKVYLFSYSKENIFISSRAQRYLILESNVDLGMLRLDFEILDEQGGLILVKDKME